MISTPPPVAQPTDWHFGEPAESFLDNGMRVLVRPMPGQQVVSITLVLDVPASVEPRDIEGVACLCALSLDEGSAAYPGERFAELLENEGAEFQAVQGFASAQVMMDVPASHLDQALALFAEAVRNPSLTDDVVLRQQRLRLAEIDQQQAHSAHLASQTFRNAVFDPGTRAQRMPGGESETVARVTPEQVREFHHRHYGPRGATLVITGDFAGDPLPSVATAFADWENAAQPVVEHEIAQPAPRRLLLVDRPGAVQADLRLGGLGIDRADPRWPDAQLGAYVVGGAFLSRLNRVLREERGFTYGVSLGFSPLRHNGSYATAGSFRTEVLVPAVVEARRLMDLRDAPVRPEELRDAQNFVRGTSPLRYSTAAGVTDQITTMVAAGLPLHWLDDLLERTRTATCESATRAYDEVVDLDDLTMVVVGDAEALADPLAEAGLQVEVVTRELRD